MTLLQQIENRLKNGTSCDNILALLDALEMQMKCIRMQFRDHIFALQNRAKSMLLGRQDNGMPLNINHLNMCMICSMMLKVYPSLFSIKMEFNDLRNYIKGLF